MADPKPQEYANRTAWRARPGLSVAIRIAVVLVPIIAAVASTFVLSMLVRRGAWSIGPRIGWMVAMFAVASAVSNAVARRTEKALPLSALCQMNLAFPEEAPNRMKLALRMGNAGRNEKVLEEFEREGLSDDPQTAALQTLELISALNTHDRRTRGHAEKVRALSDVIAEELALEEHDRNLLRWASLLHDIGKISVPATILNKNGKPTAEEWEILKGHPAQGEWRIAPLRSWLGDWARCVEEHHERFDGSGYPRGLRGDQMALGSRIVAVADSFEVMTAARSYKKPMSYEDARAELVRCSGTHFDPVVVRAFLQVGAKKTRVASGLFSSWVSQLAANNGPVGTLVQTVSNGVTASGGASILAPLVRGVQVAAAKDHGMPGRAAEQSVTALRAAAKAAKATVTAKAVAGATAGAVAVSLGVPSHRPRPTQVRVEALEWSAPFAASTQPPDALALEAPIDAAASTAPTIAATTPPTGELVFESPTTAAPRPAAAPTTVVDRATLPPKLFGPPTSGATSSTSPPATSSSSSTTSSTVAEPPLTSTTAAPAGTTTTVSPTTSTTTTVPTTTTSSTTTTAASTTTSATSTTTTAASTTTTTIATTTTTTTPPLVGGPGCPGAWTYAAYNNIALVGPVKANGCEPTINHNWGTGAPFPGVNADFFSATWEADYTFPGSMIDFTMRSDDGVRLYLDDVKVFDAWTMHSARTDVHSQVVSAGVHNVRLEYFDFTAQAVVSLDIAASTGGTTTTLAPAPTTTLTTTTSTTPPSPPLINTRVMPATSGAIDAIAVDASDRIYSVTSATHTVYRSLSFSSVTYAGNGTSGFSGDGGPALSASLDSPSAIAVTPTGELYIADNGNHRIRKVSTTGIITTVAGTGANTSAGDGGPPLAASFKDITALALRANGRLLVADRQGRRIREIDFVGNVITTVIGNGTTRGGGDGLAATSLGLVQPIDVAFYDDTVVVADRGTGIIWEVDGAGIAHFVGGGGVLFVPGSPATQFQFGELRAVALIDDGLTGAPHDVAVIDRGTHRMWRIVRATGRVEAYAGTGSSGNANFTGPATAAELDHPTDVVSKPIGQYLADSGNNAVRIVSP